TITIKKKTTPTAKSRVDETIAFLSNPKLKKAGVEIQMTAEEVIEFDACMKDPIYFLENYIKVITIDEGLTKIKLWDFQKDVIKNYLDSRITIFKCPRQMGKALSIDTKIPTPIGWKTMGELKIGDLVFGSDGK